MKLSRGTAKQGGCDEACFLDRLYGLWQDHARRGPGALTDVIVACGGGTPCHGDNMALMNEVGITVWLTTSPERITARLVLPDQKAKRPKILRLEDGEVLQLVQREIRVRSPFYSQCMLQFDSTDIETAAATEHTARRLAVLLNEVV